MRKYYIIYVASFILFVAACSLSPKDFGKAYMFALNPVDLEINRNIDETLVVALPVASIEIDSSRIALIKSGKKWDYYAGAKWSDFLPVLVQDRIVKSLEKAKLFKRATSDQSGILGDKVLKIEIRSFHAEYKRGIKAPVIKLAMIVSLKNRLDNMSIISFNISSEVQALENRKSSIQAAFSEAFNKTQEDLVYKLSNYDEQVKGKD